MPKALDIEHKRFGSLVAIRREMVPNARNVMWLCQCDCGATTIVAAANIGKTTMSCGCLARETARALLQTHGMTKTTEFKIWQGMQQRCHNTNAPSYKNYGGRGISVCERWRTDFMNFLTDMGKRPSKKHSLDRINNDGDYSPNNCQWALQRTQCRNYRGNNIVTANGETMCVLDWCERLGINRHKPYLLVRSKKMPHITNMTQAIEHLCTSSR